MGYLDRTSLVDKGFITDINFDEPASVSGRSQSPGACNYRSYPCHGVFTDLSIFSLNASRIQIPKGTLVTN